MRNCRGRLRRALTDRPARRRTLLGRSLAAVGTVGAVTAAAADPAATRSAAAQDWSPFVLVGGLLLVGLVADVDGLFTGLGQRLAGLARSGRTTFAGAVLLVAVVAAVLNLDTAAAFCTPVLVHAGRRRGAGDGALLYGCLLLANAGSLLLPGSNLTNLIVLGQLHLTGGRFVARTAAAWAVGVLVTAAVVGVAERRSLRAAATPVDPPAPLRFGVGAVAVAAAVTLVLLLRSPALPVAGVGVTAAGLTLARRRTPPGRVLDVLGLPVLVGLFAVAVVLGTAGRLWAGPAQLLGHLDAWGTAAVAAGTSVLVNNLPAASLLAARHPAHPLSLLVGLDLGPNLAVTGSLAWLLWLRAARDAGARPSLHRASRYGVVAVPLSVAAAVGVLLLTRPGG